MSRPHAIVIQLSCNDPPPPYTPRPVALLCAPPFNPYILTCRRYITLFYALAILQAASCPMGPTEHLQRTAPACLMLHTEHAPIYQFSQPYAPILITATDLLIQQPLQPEVHNVQKPWIMIYSRGSCLKKATHPLTSTPLHMPPPACQSNPGLASARSSHNTLAPRLVRATSAKHHPLEQNPVPLSS